MKHASSYSRLIGFLAFAEFEAPSDTVKERRLREELDFGTLTEPHHLEYAWPDIPLGMRAPCDNKEEAGPYSVGRLLQLI